MRPTERINNFWCLIDWRILKERWGCDFNTDPLVQMEIIEYWNKNTDMRIGQVLINLGLIANNLQIWCDKEEDILIDQGISPEECLYWTSYYDKDMNPIPKVSKLIKDLDTDHINNIYTHMFKGNRELSDKYMKAFRNVLVDRNESTDVLDFIEKLWKMEVIGE